MEAYCVWNAGAPGSSPGTSTDSLKSKLWIGDNAGWGQFGKGAGETGWFRDCGGREGAGVVSWLILEAAEHKKTRENL